MISPVDLRANLHLHSIFSDGVWTPEELAKLAKKEGYEALALTDHDTTAGCERMKAAAKAEGMDWLFGCEFAVKVPHDIHVTAFEFDPEYPPMRDYMASLCASITEQTRCVFELARENGEVFGLSWQDVLDSCSGISFICHEQIRQTFEKKGVIERADYQAWFEKNVRRQRRLFKKTFEPLELKDLVKLIHEAGGLAIYAHPMYTIYYIEEILATGIDGIEVWHPEQTQTQAEKSLRVALERGLYISGGSDHSGPCGGCCEFITDEKERVKNRLFIPESCCGTTREFFEEIKNRRINR